MKTKIREFLILLSLSNLFFLPLWAKWLKWTNGYFLPLDSISLHLVALILNVLILAFLMWVGLQVVKKKNRSWLTKLTKFLFPFLLIIPLNGARTLANISIGQVVERAGRLFYISVFFVLILIFWILKKWFDKFFGVVSVILLVLAPYVIITFSQAIIILTKLDPIYQNSIYDKSTYSESFPEFRVLWLILDEMDQRIAFEQRPDNLDLPELDRLRKESFYATNALSPASDTKQSVPALLTGLPIIDSKEISPDELVLIKENGDELMFGQQKTIFEDILEIGYRSAVAGRWYHPYCRLFGEFISNCTYEYTREDFIEKKNISGIFKIVLDQTLQLQPWYNKFFQTQHEYYEGDLKTELHKNILINSKSLFDERNIALAFVHLSIPHAPFIFDRTSNSFSDAHIGVSGYLDNLVLADQYFGELRKSMEDSGVWENTAVIVSSDHHWRRSDEFDGIEWDRRVPFILKLPKEIEGVEYTHEFDTIITKDIIIKFLKKEITSYKDIHGLLVSQNT